MNKKEKEELLTVIQQEDRLLRKLTNMVRNSAVIAAIALVFTIWGFLDFQDPLLPHLSSSTKHIIAWIALVICILAFVLTILAFIARKVGKKSLMAKINKYQGKDYE